jgi:cyclic pyranopterin phosphate synthase
MAIYDSFKRKLDYLRISVTDRCNLRCRYCMPEEGLPLFPKSEILSFEEIFDFTKIAAAHGISKVRLTGGEPLVRPGITTLVQMLSSLPEIKDLAITTNGSKLEELAFELKKAGLNRINVSLDAIDPDEYRRITRLGDVKKVLRGIEAAQKAGLSPIKINCVIKSSVHEKNAEEVAAFAGKNGFEIRFIYEMDLETGHFAGIEGGSGGDCKNCNRLRLSSNGWLYPCLFNDLRFNIRELGAEKAIELAADQKPKAGNHSLHNHFSQIGG